MAGQCQRQINIPTNPIPADFARQLERELADVKQDLDFKSRLANAMTEQRDRLAEALRGLLKTTPSDLYCEDFHHPKADRHGDAEECPPTKRFRDARLKAELALAAVKESPTTTTP